MNIHMMFEYSLIVFVNELHWALEVEEIFTIGKEREKIRW